MIKKYIILFVFIITTSVIANGQINYGVKTGINFSNTSFRNEVKVGAHLGAIANIDFSEKIFLKPEIIYAQKGFKFPSTSFSGAGNSNFHYINVPVLIGFKPVNKFSLLFGPEVGYLMTATSNVDGKRVDITSVYERLDFGVALGGSYDLSSKFAIEIRYVRGFNMLIKRSDLDMQTDENGNIIGYEAKETTYGRNRTFQLGVNYFFKKK